MNNISRKAIYRHLLRNKKQSKSILGQKRTSLISTYKKKGLNFASQGKFKTSEKYFKKILTIDKKNTKAMCMLGDIYEKGYDNYNEAIKWYSKAISVGDNDPEPFTKLGYIYVRRDFEECNYEKARMCFENAMKLKANSDLYFDIGWCSYELDEYEKAAKYLELARIHDFHEDRRSTSQLLLAYIYTKKGETNPKYLDIALQYYKEALEKDDTLEIKLGMAQCYMNMSNFEEAEKLLNEIKEVEPDDSEILSNFVKLYILSGRIDMAYNLAGSILLKNEKHVYTRYLYGKILYDKNEYSKAAEHLEYALSKSNGHIEEDPEENDLLGESLSNYQTVDANYYLGLCNFNLGKLNKAEENLKYVVQYDTSNAHAHLILGEVYESLRNIEEAIQHYRTAQLLDPYLLKASFKAGTLYAQKENYEQSIIYFEKAINNYNDAKKSGEKVDIENENEFLFRTYNNIAAAYQRLSESGDKSKTREYLNRHKQFLELSHQFEKEASINGI